MKTYKFKLYNSKRNKHIHNLINIAGGLYNYCIALHKRYYRIFHKVIHRFDMHKHLTRVKRLPKHAHWNFLGAETIYDVADRIDAAYKRHFSCIKKRMKSSPPGFKKVKRYKSFTFHQTGYKYFGDDGYIILSVIKKKFKFHKSRDIEGKIKTVTFKRDALGDIYVYLTCDNGKENEVLLRTGKSVGFKFGLTTFLTGSDGYKITPPLFYANAGKLLAKAHRNLSKKQRGSNNRERARLELVRVYKKLTNQRSDFHWKLANELCAKYSIICFETPSLQDTAERNAERTFNKKSVKTKWGKKTLDLAFYEFLQKLKHVANKTGVTIVQIDKYFPNTQKCHDCGVLKPAVKDLALREWDCPNCGSHHDRYLNAAKNILDEGLKLA